MFRTVQRRTSLTSAVIEVMEVRNHLSGAWEQDGKIYVSAGGHGVTVISKSNPQAAAIAEDADIAPELWQHGTVVIPEGESGSAVAHGDDESLSPNEIVHGTVEVPEGHETTAVGHNEIKEIAGLKPEFTGPVTKALNSQGHSSEQATVTVPEGESYFVVGEHHTGTGHPNDPTPGTDDSHYFLETGDSHHFAWTDQDTSSPDIIDIYYDFRSYNGYTNSITTAEKNASIVALQKWEEATLGKLNFVQSTTSANANTLIIGKGNMAALGSTGGAGGVLGLGGGTYSHVSSTSHPISYGVSWMDVAETWDTTIGNGNPAGTVDFFTVVGQEIGHALGLGHTDNVSSNDLMDGSYDGEVSNLSSQDVVHAQSLYSPFNGGTLQLFGSTGNDTITVTQSGSIYSVNFNGVVSSYNASSVSNFSFDAGAGNDFVNFASTITRNVTIAGSKGNDTLYGAAADDALSGGSDTGADFLKGFGGDDILEGYAGNDNLVGGAGSDRLFGNDGDDVIDAGDSELDVYINGGLGSDTAYYDVPPPSGVDETSILASITTANAV